MKLTSKTKTAIIALVHMAENNVFCHANDANAIDIDGVDGVRNAVNDGVKVIAIKEIAENLNISVNFLEQIFNKLKSNDIIISKRGKNGGYYFAKPIEEITVLEILDSMEEEISGTICKGRKNCIKKSIKCKAHDLLTGFEKYVKNYFINISIYDILNDNLKGKLNL